jgi:hypothetical protein
MVHSVDSSNVYIEYLVKLNIFKEILYLARFGNRDCKPPSLEFLAALVQVSN